MRTPKLWKLLPHDPLATDRLSKSLNLAPALAQLLPNRGIREADEVDRFLKAPLSGLHDPAMLPGVTEAAARIHQAVGEHRRICIYGDYDVDGMTGTTILWRCLQMAGADVEFYVPHRLEEGYGLNREALQKLKEQQGVNVVVTVDCGICSLAEAATAKELGLELIITDHHEYRDTLPDAAVLVHPRLPGSTYPFPYLSGAGVAFKLAWAICQEFSQAKKVSEAFRQFLLESVSLVAFGAVADVMPLIDENRIFVRHGLKSLKHAPSIGLKALLEAAELNGKTELDSGHIGFQLAPRLNAVGRLGQARLGVELLGTTSPQRAADLARYLNEQNELRKTIERRILHQAREMIEAEHDLDSLPALVLASEEWHAGVIGIVAGQLAERYGRPVLMISLKEALGQGSGRSVNGFKLHEALCACTQHLESHGGHAAAAGFRIRAQAVDLFRQSFCEYAAGQLDPGAPGRGNTIVIDTEVSLNALTTGLLKSLAAMHPYGVGNRRPVFMATGLQVVGTPRKVGGGERHLQFQVRQEGVTMKAIAFSMAERLEELMSQAGQCSLVFTPKPNEWQGRLFVDLEVSDFQPGPRPVLA